MCEGPFPSTRCQSSGRKLECATFDLQIARQQAHQIDAQVCGQERLDGPRPLLTLRPLSWPHDVALKVIGRGRCGQVRTNKKRMPRGIRLTMK